MKKPLPQGGIKTSAAVLLHLYSLAAHDTRRSMTVELKDRCGYDFTIDYVSECEVIPLITKSDLYLIGELVYSFP
jgi:hypothetical protein